MGNDDGGTLHGHWGTYSLDVTSSDRRLKENIRPVFETLRTRHSLDASGGGGGELGGGLLGSAVMDTVLQKLRPVSYNLRSEGNQMRFGFIADEMLGVLPELTRTSKNRDNTMGILYQDLIAVLVAQMQHMFSEMDHLSKSLADVERRIQQRRLWRAGRNWVGGRTRRKQKK